MVQRYEPFEALRAVTKFAGEGAQLLQIEARAVKPNGTVDLTADAKPLVSYIFLAPGEQEPELPVGAGAQASLLHTKVLVGRPGEYVVQRPGGGAGAAMRVAHAGMIHAGRSGAPADARDRVVPPPRCTLAGLWNKAIAAGAPADTVALLRYDHRGYTFRLDEPVLQLRFDIGCQPSTTPTARPTEAEVSPEEDE